MAMRGNRFVGGSLRETVRAAEAREPGFAAAVEAEFNRLQVARRVRALREKRRLTQAGLAEKVGTTQSAIARLESGRVLPNLDLLARIAAALGLRVDVRFVACEA